MTSLLTEMQIAKCKLQNAKLRSYLTSLLKQKWQNAWGNAKCKMQHAKLTKFLVLTQFIPFLIVRRKALGARV